jgi:hypothetical protein
MEKTIEYGRSYLRFYLGWLEFETHIKDSHVDKVIIGVFVCIILIILTCNWRRTNNRFNGREYKARPPVKRSFTL